MLTLLLLPFNFFLNLTFDPLTVGHRGHPGQLCMSAQGQYVDTVIFAMPFEVICNLTFL